IIPPCGAALGRRRLK
ncbi:IlvGEDA operon leader peptide, partial [Providencia rettgeri]|nr:IlvGEDA operon leader peptide [Providencia rettgeri]